MRSQGSLVRRNGGFRRGLSRSVGSNAPGAGFGARVAALGVSADREKRQRGLARTHARPSNVVEGGEEFLLYRSLRTDEGPYRIADGS
jgi:hypothetical protein